MVRVERGRPYGCHNGIVNLLKIAPRRLSLEDM